MQFFNSMSDLKEGSLREQRQQLPTNLQVASRPSLASKREMLLFPSSAPAGRGRREQREEPVGDPGVLMSPLAGRRRALSSERVAKRHSALGQDERTEGRGQRGRSHVLPRGRSTGGVCRILPALISPAGSKERGNRFQSAEWRRTSDLDLSTADANAHLHARRGRPPNAQSSETID